MKRLLIVEIEHCDECSFFKEYHYNMQTLECVCEHPECDVEAWKKWYNNCIDSWTGVFSGCPLPKITGNPDD